MPTQPGHPDRAFLRPKGERRGSRQSACFPFSVLPAASHASVVASRYAHASGLRDGGGDAGADRVGMRVHLALGKLNVSQILLRTQSGAGSHIRGCL